MRPWKGLDEIHQLSVSVCPCVREWVPLLFYVRRDNRPRKSVWGVCYLVYHTVLLYCHRVIFQIIHRHILRIYAESRHIRQDGCFSIYCAYHQSNMGDTISI